MKNGLGDGYGGDGFHTQPAIHRSTFIFLHGLGDTADGWSNALQSLLTKRPALQHTKLILPTAPTRKITLNGGMAMPGWADIFGLSPSDVEDEQGYKQSVARIQTIIDGEIEKGIQSTKIVIGGFSQGGAVCLLGLVNGFSDRLGGVIALSAWLPLRGTNTATTQQQTSTPILHCHGEADPIVDHKFGELSVNALRKMGFKVEFKSFPGMGHHSSNEELFAVATFLEKAFEGT